MTQAVVFKQKYLTTYYIIGASEVFIETPQIYSCIQELPFE